MRNFFRLARDEGRVLLICILSLVAPALVAAQTAAPGERLSINADWRFQMGDPADLTTPLMYDVRPVVTLTEDGKEADAKPEEAAKVAAANQQVLKPWILPSGNAFIKDPARRYQRPAGDPGSNVSYVQASFDDSAWRNVTLAARLGDHRPVPRQQVRTAAWADCRAGASAGIERSWTFRRATATARYFWISTARCPTRPCGSTASSSAVGPTATTRSASISRRI